MRGWILAGWLLAGALSAMAGQVDYGQGGSSAWQLAAGTRALAVGSAAGLLAQDSSLLAHDPGAMVFTGQGEAGVHHGLWAAGASWDQASALLPVDAQTAVALLSGLASYGSFDRTDASGQRIGTYNAGEALLGAGMARRFGDVGLGVGGFWSRQTIDQSVAMSYAWSAGLDWQALPILAVAVAGRASTEALSASQWSGDLGARVGPSDWQVVLNSHYEDQATSSLQVALSHRLRAGGLGLELLGGWQVQFPAVDLGLGYGWTGGLSVTLGSWALDYAFVPMGEFEAQHHLGLRYLYGAPRPRPAAAPTAAAPPVPMPPALPLPAPMPTAFPTPHPPAPLAPVDSPVAAVPDPGLAVDVLTDAVLKGESLEFEGKPLQALAAYRQAIEANGQDRQAWKHLARLYDKLGRPAYAHSCWSALAALDPSDPEALGALGNALPAAP